jgi:hypothetical protein
MKDFVYAPVVIPTLCRYEHFRRCVESLSRCTHADKTELFIGLDYPINESHYDGYNKIKKFLPSICGFSKVVIVERTENYGPIKNLLSLYEMVYQKHDRIIISEDDNEFAPCFLDFVDKGLEIYKNDPKVLSICGFNQYYVEGERIIFTYDNSAWGIARWRDKFTPGISETKDALSHFRTILRVYHFYPALLNSIVNALKKGRINGDANMSCYSIAHDCYQLRPANTLVRNWGHDGSGIHCGVSGNYNNMELPTQTTFSFQPTEPIRTQKIDSLVRNNMMPKSRKRYFRFKIRVLYNALSYYLRKK